MSAEWLISKRVVDRANELLARDRDLQATRSSPADVDAILAAGGSSIQYLAAACERYADRACFITREHAVTYRALWARVTALAAAATARELVSCRQRIGIFGAPSPDWVVADLTCLHVGAVSVPLHLGMSREQLAHAIRQARLETIFCGVPELASIRGVLDECPAVRAVIVMGSGAATPEPTAPSGPPGALRVFAIEALEREAGQAAPAIAASPSGDDDPLVTVVFSSGTTGMPKGVMLTERRWSAQLRFALQWPRIPHVHLGYLPLSHITGRRLVLEVMINGGVTHFPASADVTSLFDDMRAARPTVIPLVPHVATLAYQHFQAEYLRAGGTQATTAVDDPIGEQVMAQMRRSFLSDRVCLVRTGTAPLAPEVIEFVARCFDVPVANGYGSTELGSIAVNGRVLPQHEYKLVDVPELGYYVTDAPPRGELVVRSTEATIGYLDEPAATAALFDRDGFLHTGDVVEESSPGFIVPIGRRGHVLRLAHGEFVNVTGLETLYSGRIPLVQQIFIHGDPHRSALLAVIVPRAEGDATDAASLRQQLRRELNRVARELSLPPHQVPRDFLIELEPFSRDNHLLTDALKLDRIRITAAYRERLEQLYARIDARALDQHRAQHRDGGDDPATRSVEQRVRGALIAALGVDAGELEAAWSQLGFTGLGGDSLDAVRFCELVKDAVGVLPQVAVVLDPTTTLAAVVDHVDDLLDRVDREPDRSSFEAAHGDAGDRVDARDLDIDRLLGGVVAASSLPAAARPPRTIVLTGATGFLGRFLLLELLERMPGGRVVCLVRAADDRAALDRLRAGYAGYARAGDRSLATVAQAVGEGRVVVHASDLIRPDLGLDRRTYAELQRAADAIVHNGALVNHALSYRSLFAPNVAGTVEIIRFALGRRHVPIHFVSSIGIVDRGDAASAAGAVREDQSARELWPTRAVGAGLDDYAVGYITSKWAAELLLTQAHERYGVPVNIFRCGVLFPHQRIPAALNERDAFNRLLFGIIATGLAPRSFYAPGPSTAAYFGGIPVDVAAASLVAIALGAGDGIATYHVDAAVRERGSLDRFIDAIERAGVAIERLPYGEWYSRCHDALARLSEPARSWSPLPIMRRWASPIDPGARRWFDNRRFRDQLGPGMDAEIAPLTGSFVDEWIRSLCALRGPL